MRRGTGASTTALRTLVLGRFRAQAFTNERDLEERERPIIPEELLADVDRAARERGESRSKYITRVLHAAVRARRDMEITRCLNELFAREEGIASEQRASAAALDELGSDWSDERW